MNKIDFSKYKFRCSSLPTLMTASRSKNEPLSETAKSALREIWIEVVYDRKKYDTTNRFTEKGIMCEPDAFDLIKKVTGETYFKNKIRFENEWISGEPDIVIDRDTPKGRVKDSKVSWSIWTFNNATEDSMVKQYYWQMQGYLWLTGCRFADIVPCLINTPEEIIQDELYKLSFKLPELSNSEELTNKVRKNYIFDDIEPKKRMKSFVVEFSEEDCGILQDRILHAREYLGTLSL